MDQVLTMQFHQTAVFNAIFAISLKGHCILCKKVNGYYYYRSEVENSSALGVAAMADTTRSEATYSRDTGP